MFLTPFRSVGYQIDTCMPFSLYLWHGFCPESEKPDWNRVKHLFGTEHKLVSACEVILKSRSEYFSSILTKYQHSNPLTCLKVERECPENWRGHQIHYLWKILQISSSCSRACWNDSHGFQFNCSFIDKTYRNRNALRQHKNHKHNMMKYMHKYKFKNIKFYIPSPPKFY